MPRISRLWHAYGRSYLPALLGYLLLASLFYAPILSGLRTFPDGDFTYHFLSFSLFQRSELLAGRLPLWNPYTYGGHPFLADTQAAVFYPLSNLLLGLPDRLPAAATGRAPYRDLAAAPALAIAARLRRARQVGLVDWGLDGVHRCLPGGPPANLPVYQLHNSGLDRPPAFPRVAKDRLGGEAPSAS
jgi:hypothetical protein